MLIRLQKIARRLHPFRSAFIIVGIFSLLAFVSIIFLPYSTVYNKYISPTFISIVWSLGFYSFTGSFLNIPEKANKEHGILFRVKTMIHRAWLYILAIICLITILASLILTYRLLSIWIKDY